STVVAVVALAGDDDHPPAVRATEQVERGAGDGGTGPLDQHLDRLRRGPVDRSHLLRREDRYHRATTTASAMRSVWVNETRHDVMPRSPASAAAPPVMANDGAPLSTSRTTSTSRNAKAPSPTPIAFIVASLAANRAARPRVFRAVRRSASVNSRCATLGRRARTSPNRPTSTASMPIPI